MDGNFLIFLILTTLLSVNGTLNEGLFHLSSSCVGIFPIASFFFSAYFYFDISAVTYDGTSFRRAIIFIRMGN